MSKSRFFILTGIIFSAALSRLVPHPWNVSPIGAMALFGASFFDRKSLAFFVPLLALLLSDAIIGFYQNILWVYGAFALIVLIGFWVKENRSFSRIFSGSLLSSIVFFLVTNFGVWISGVEALYPKNFAGFITCLTMAIPFFRNTVLGDLFYVVLLFGGMTVLERKLSFSRASSSFNTVQ